MDKTATIAWKAGQPESTVVSAEELRRELLHVRASLGGELVTAEVRVLGGARFYIGLGPVETYLLIHEPVAGSEWTNEWISIGNPERTDEIDYSLFGHHTPHPGFNVIPFELALEGVVRYFESGERSPDIEWESNCF